MTLLLAEYPFWMDFVGFYHNHRLLSGRCLKRCFSKIPVVLELNRIIPTIRFGFHPFRKLIPIYDLIHIQKQHVLNITF